MAKTINKQFYPQNTSIVIKVFLLTTSITYTMHFIHCVIASVLLCIFNHSTQNTSNILYVLLYITQEIKLQPPKNQLDMFYTKRFEVLPDDVATRFKTRESFTVLISL